MALSDAPEAPAAAEAPPDWRRDPAGRRREWFRYYSEKRIGHQWFQLHLLDGLPVERVLEVGPNLGLVTALLDNAGFRVTTLDMLPAQYERQDIPHIEADLLAVPPERLAGFDAIVCCETLEHLHWEKVEAVLAAFRRAAPRFLVVSVPYMGFQLEWRVYLNAHRWRRSFSLKWLKFLKPFRFDERADPWGHKWEVGYRGRSLADLEAKLAATGWRIRRRDFTSPCRSVFYLLEPA